MKVNLTAKARDDLLDIWLYIAEGASRAVADRVLDNFERTCARLGEFPQLGRARPEIHADARSLVVERWLMLYRIAAEKIEIVRIIDGVRDLSAIEWKPET